MEKGDDVICNRILINTYTKETNDYERTIKSNDF